MNDGNENPTNAVVDSNWPVSVAAAGRTMPNLTEPVWQFEYAIDCNATRHFVWDYWTNISNWDDPPAEIRLDGPFAPGSRFTTKLPEQEPLYSVIRSVTAQREATIDLQLPGAILSFCWRFEDLPGGERTKLTQLLTLSGTAAQDFVGQVAIFEDTVPEGMKRLAAAISAAAQ